MRNEQPMNDRSTTLYPPHILDHYRNPRNYGKLEGYNVSGSSRNPSCGDVVSFQGFVREGVLEQIRFEGSGCMLSQAAASIVCEYVQGKKVVEIERLTKEQVYTLVGVTLGPTRARCVDLVLEVLQSALK